MERQVSFCGLYCEDCTAYQATQAADNIALERVAALWRQAFDTNEIGTADITCDGCTAVSGRLAGYCAHCPIRTCALEHGVPHCSLCRDYPCQQLEEFFAKLDDFETRWEGFFTRPQDQRATLEALHALVTKNKEHGLSSRSSA